MNLKKHLPMVISAIIGALLSTKYAIIGILILLTILIVYRKYIPEIISIFTETESNKIETILLIGIMGFGTIIAYKIDNFIVAMLVVAWMIVMILLMRKLSLMNLQRQFELEIKEIDLRNSIPLKEHCERMKRITDIAKEHHNAEMYNDKPDTS